MDESTQGKLLEPTVEFGTVRYRWVVFSLLSFIYMLVFFHRQAPAVLALDLMRDLNLKGASLGLLSAAYFYPYAFIQIPSGAIVRSLGARRSLCIFFALAGFGAVGFSCTSSFFMALFFRVLVGVGAAMVLVPVLEIISAWFKHGEFTSMIGLLIGVAGLGVFAGAAPLSYLDALVGWRGSFMIVGAVSLLCVACLWLFVRNRPQELGYPAVDHEMEPVVTSGIRESATLSIQVLTSPAFWPPTIWAFLSLGIFISFGGLWGGPYLMHVHGLSKVDTGHVLGMLALGMIIGGPFLGLLAERVFKSRKKVLIGAGFILVLLTGSMVFGLDDFSLWGLFVWFGLLGLTTMAAAPLSLTLVRNAFPRELAGIATGLANFFFIVGGALMQQGAGWILDLRGYSISGGSSGHYEYLFKVYFVCGVLALLAALLARDEKSSSV